MDILVSFHFRSLIISIRTCPIPSSQPFSLLWFYWWTQEYLDTLHSKWKHSTVNCSKNVILFIVIVFYHLTCINPHFKMFRTAVNILRSKTVHSYVELFADRVKVLYELDSQALVYCWSRIQFSKQMSYAQ